MKIDDPETAYLEAIGRIWPTLPESEQRAFQRWKDAHPMARNSDWDGWQKYIGARPVRSGADVSNSKAS